MDVRRISGLLASGQSWRCRIATSPASSTHRRSTEVSPSVVSRVLRRSSGSDTSSSGCPVVGSTVRLRVSSARTGASGASPPEPTVTSTPSPTPATRSTRIASRTRGLARPDMLSSVMRARRSTPGSAAWPSSRIRTTTRSCSTTATSPSAPDPDSPDPRARVEPAHLRFLNRMSRTPPPLRPSSESARRGAQSKGSDQNEVHDHDVR